MPQYPKYAAAVEWAAIVPVVGLLRAVMPFRHKTDALLVALHAAATLTACVGIATHTHIMTAASVAIAVACWVYTLFKINHNSAQKPHPPAALKIVETFSPVSYVLAYPLIFTPTSKIDRAAGVVLLVLHIVTVPMIALLIWAEELHDAWGCYGSQRSLADYDKGMCGQWNIDQIQICRDLQKKRPPNVDCTSETTAFEFFGVLLHRIVQLQIISFTVWIHLMILQYYREKKKLA